MPQILASRQYGVSHEFDTSCSRTASLVVEAVSGERIEGILEENKESKLGDHFVGVSYINMKQGNLGHRMAVLHLHDEHRVIQSNNLPTNANLCFSRDDFLDGKIANQDKIFPTEVLDTISTDVYTAWIQKVKDCVHDPEVMRKLTGVAVSASEVYIKTFPASPEVINSHQAMLDT